MITDKDVEILSHLRCNARGKVTVLSRTLKMPATTLYDRIRAQSKRGIVKKHVALLDFAKIGYGITALLGVKVPKEKRNQMQDYLFNYPNVNSLYRTNYCYDFIAEVVFEDMVKLQEFIEGTAANFNVEEPAVFNIIEELKKESFLSNAVHGGNHG